MPMERSTGRPAWVSSGIVLGLAVLASVGTPDLGRAAVPKTKNSRTLAEALSRPQEERLSVIRNQFGGAAFPELEKMAFADDQPLSLRWRALMALATLYPSKSQKALDRAAQSKEWFMRNAALVAGQKGQRDQALKHAKRLLADRALVVRTAAVQSIHRLGAREMAGDLWRELYSSRNYRGRQSLWVRHHIAGALAQFARPGEELRFLRMLEDEDSRLYPHAVTALEKLTQKSFRNDGDITAQRQRWLAWRESSRESERPGGL